VVLHETVHPRSRQWHHGVMGERKEIAVIGAGASGLAVARALRQLGHDDVVVLESAPRAGGKCCTMNHNGRSYELGAAVITPAYRQVRSLLDEHGVSTKLRPGARFLDPRTGRLAMRPMLPPELGLRDTLRLSKDVMRLIVGPVRAQKTRFPRLDAVPRAWYQSFGNWARMNELTPLLDILRPWATGLGYGFMEEMPAAYVINYMCLAGPFLELQEVGFGGLLQRVAARLDVRIGTRVERVARADNGVVIQTDRGTFDVERVVLACSFESAREFLDTRPEEQALFSEGRALDFQLIMANTRGLPSSAYVFLAHHAERAHCGKPTFYYRRYPDSGIINFYSYRGEGGLDGAEREVLALVDGLGGEVTEIITRRSYRHSPHVTSDGFGRDFHGRMQALQGQQRTFYVSEELTLGCVEAVVSYAQLVAKHMASGAHAKRLDLPWYEVANDATQGTDRRTA
jgi:hypothetical protein